MFIHDDDSGARDGHADRVELPGNGCRQGGRHYGFGRAIGVEQADGRAVTGELRNRADRDGRTAEAAQPPGAQAG